MRNLKRVLSLALALVMVLGMMVITTSAADYADKDDIIEKESVEVLSALGIVSGDGTNFNPDGNFTRRDAAKLIAYMLGFGKTAEKLSAAGLFTDVAADHWSAGYIAFCADRGYIVGNGDGTFNPKGELTDIELGKLVLCALGYDAAKYTGSNWATAVTVDMLGAGLVEEVTGEVISRENACAMILTAMKAPTTESKGWYYVGMEETLGYFDTYSDAFLAANTIITAAGGTFVPANVVKDAGDCLLKDVHGWNYNTTGKYDTYGRAAVSYDNGKDGDELVELTYTTEKAVKIYDAATKAETIAEDLKGYKIGSDAVENTTTKKAWTGTGSVRVDGGSAKTIGNTVTLSGKTLSEALAALTGDNKVVEIYANAEKAITKIIIVETNYAVVTNAAEATAETDASFKVDGKTVTKVEGFKNGDVVTYVEDSTGVTEVTKLEGFAGTMTKYNKNNVFTIGDTEYKVSEVAIDGEDTLIAEIISEQGDEMFYFLDKNGNIVDMTTVPGAEEEEEEEVVITDYAIVLASKAAVEYKVETAEWPAEGKSLVTTFTAKIQVLLDDGTVEIWDVPVVKADKAIADTDIAKDDYYFCPVGKTPVKITLTDIDLTIEDPATLAEEVETAAGEDTTTLAGLLEALEGVVYTYADKALVAEVAALDGSEEEDCIVVTANTGNIGSTTYVDGTVILNDKTVFLLQVTDEETEEVSYVLKTGLTALEETTITETVAIITAVTAGKNADGTANTEKNVNVATLVIAYTTEFDPTDVDPEGTDEYVFVTGDYSVTKSEGKTYYTYDVVYADGTTGTFEEEAGNEYSALAAGIYSLLDDGSVNTDSEDEDYYFDDTVLEVKLVSGTTVLFTEGDPMTTNDKTVVIGGELAAGAKAYIVGTGVIELAFIVE